MVFGSGFQRFAVVLPRPVEARPGCGRTHPRSMLKSRLRTIHRLLSANNIVRRAVFLATHFWFGPLAWKSRCRWLGAMSSCWK